MRRAFCFLLTVCSAISTVAVQGTVSTLDGRKLEGEIEFANGALVVKPAHGEALTVAAMNIFRAQFSTNVTAGETKGRGTGLLGIYYNSTNFTGPAVMRLDETVSFDWQQEAPVLGVRRDLFSVRWMGLLEAQSSEQYTIHFGSADGGRIYFDGKLVADHWAVREYAETNVTVNLKAGEKHKLKLEHFDAFGTAQARLFWSTASMSKTSVPPGRLYAMSFEEDHKADVSGGAGLLATYYNRDDFMSNSFTRVDPEIDFDWKGAPPAPGIASNRFSVRWCGSLRITNSGEYKFYIQTGTPQRLFINDKLISDSWTVAPEQAAMITLRTGGRCELRLELRVTSNVAPVRLLWSGPGFEKTLIARQHLSPGIAPSGVIPTGSGPVLPAGVVLLNGATIGAPIQSANDSSIRFQGLFSKQPLPLAKVARLHVMPLTAAFAATIPKGRTGVLLKNRDFIDGEFAGIENGRLKIGSVLFGNRTFDLAKDVVAVVLRENEPPSWRYSIAARDGTVVYGQTISISPLRVALTVAPEFSLPPGDLMEIIRRSEAENTQ